MTAVSDFINIKIAVEDGRRVITFMPPTAALYFYPANGLEFVALLREERPGLDRSLPPVEEMNISVSFKNGQTIVKFAQEIGRLTLNALQADALSQKVDGYVLEEWEQGTELSDGTLIVQGPGGHRVMRPGPVRLPLTFNDLVDLHRRAQAAGADTQEKEIDWIRHEIGEDVYDAIPWQDRRQAARDAIKDQKSRRGRKKKDRLPRIRRSTK
jgi:hypothetical protein